MSCRELDAESKRLVDEEVGVLLDHCGLDVSLLERPKPDYAIASGGCTA